MLLTHTVGLGYDLADPDLVKWSAKVGRTANNLDWSREGFTTPLKFAPGEGWYYGTALDWAGLVLEAVTGQSLGRYMQEHVFDPLGMADTGFWPEKLPQTASRTVVCSLRDASSLSLKPMPQSTPREHDVESGGAGLFTTAADYARFLHGFLGGTLVGAAAVREMFTPQLTEAQSDMLELICYRSGVQDGFAPEFPTGLALNHGIGGAMNMEDVPGKRRKGSLMWSGMCNSRWVSPPPPLLPVAWRSCQALTETVGRPRDRHRGRADSRCPRARRSRRRALVRRAGESRICASRRGKVRP